MSVDSPKFSEGNRRVLAGQALFAAATTTRARTLALREQAAGFRLMNEAFGGTETLPTAGFDAISAFEPLGAAVGFRARTAGTIATYSWDFGDGSGTSTDANPTYQYAAAGTYSVTLTVTDGLGNSDTTTRTDYVTIEGETFAVDFEADVTSGNAPLAVTFTPSYFGASGNIEANEWDYGDGNSSTTLGEHTYVYTTPGTYTVELFARDEAEQTDTETKTNYVVVSPAPALDATFTATPTTGTPTLNSKFTYSVSGGVPPYTYSLDPGDGQGAVTTNNPSVAYATPGTYTPELTVTDSDTPTPNQDVFSRTDYIVVQSPPPPPPPSPPPPPPPPPGMFPVVTFAVTETAGDTSVANQVVEPGTELNVAWTTSDADSVLVFDSEGNTSTSLSGNYDVTPVRSNTFQLIATDTTTGHKTVARISVVVNRVLSAVVASGTVSTSLGNIPNFWSNPDFTAVQDGDWDDPDTWGEATAPTENDKVLVPSPRTVTVRGRANYCACLNIPVGGKVQHPHDETSVLHLSNLWFKGTYQRGTAANPLQAGVVALTILQNRAFDDTTDSNHWGNIVLNQGTLDEWGLEKTDKVRALGGIAAGDTFVDVSPVPDWTPGERVWIPRSEQVGTNNAHTFTTEDELRTVQYVEDFGDGTARVHLTSAVTYDHPGVVDVTDGSTPYRPHLESLDRNGGWITAVPTDFDTRAHVFHDGPNLATPVQDHWVVWHGTGRTISDEVDQGTDIGATNRPPPAENAFRLPLRCYKMVGGVMRGLSVIDPFPVVNQSPVLWGITLDECVSTQVLNCASVNWSGACIIVRNELDGTGDSCVIDGCFTGRVRGNGDRGSEHFRLLGCLGTGIWTRPNHYIRNNVCTSSTNYLLFMFGFGETELRPIREFYNNEAYGTSLRGMAYWYVNTDQSDAVDGFDVTTDTQVFEKVVIWNVGKFAVYPYHGFNMRWIDCTFMNGRDRLLNNTTISTGWQGLDYNMAGSHWIRCIWKGFQTGVQVPVKTGTANKANVDNTDFPYPLRYEDCIFHNKFNADVMTPSGTSAGGIFIAPSRVTFANCYFHDGPTTSGKDGVPYHIRLIFPNDGANYTQNIISVGKCNIIVMREVFVEDYQQVPGDDFQVFFPQQATTFSPVPSSEELNPNNPVDGLAYGAPTEGLSNQQMFDTYGLWVHNSPMPAGADNTTRPDIKGYTYPVS